MRARLCRTADRRQVRCDAQAAYYACPDTSFEAKVYAAGLCLKEKYGDTMSHHHRRARAAVALMLAAGAERDPFAERPRSGRPRLETRVSVEDRQACIDEIAQGWVDDSGKPRAFGTQLRGAGKCASVMQAARFGSRQLLTVLKRHSPGKVKVVTEKVKKVLTPACKELRLRCARERLAELAADPDWHKRVVCIDAAKVYLHELVDARRKVVTVAGHDLGTYAVQEPRLDGINNHNKRVASKWTIAVSGTGAVSPWVEQPGSTGYKEKGVSSTSCFACCN